MGLQELRQQVSEASARVRRGEEEGRAVESSTTGDQAITADEKNNILSGDNTSQDEGAPQGEASQESSGVEQERVWARKKKRHNRRAKKRRRDEGDDDDDEDSYVEAKVPVNLLELLSLLAVSLKLSVRQQLTFVMAVYILCDIDPCKMQLSLASALRYCHRATSCIAEDRMAEVAKKVTSSQEKIFIHFDTKIIEEDLEGEKQKIERLVIAISSPALEREVLLCAFPLESGTGEAMADAVWAVLTSPALKLQNHVGGIVADTTASNFGKYSGSITILQEYIGYPVLVIPCQHHTNELPAKHVTRLVSGRKTTGVGETIFITYKNNNKEVKEALQENNPVQYRTFDWEKYAGTCVESLARRIIRWVREALANNIFSRGDYRYAVKLVLVFFGVHLPGFILERPKDTSPARFLAHGIYYLEIFLTLNLPVVYELFTSPQRDEINLLSMYSACYYIPSMVSSKFAPKTPFLVLDLVCELTKLRDVHPEIANCALGVVSRHLEPLAGEMAILCLADEDLPALEREEVGQELWRLGSNSETWKPGHMKIEPVMPPPIMEDETIVLERPRMRSFINSQSLLLLDQLGWTQEDLQAEV